MSKNELPADGDGTAVHAAVLRQHPMTGHGINASSAAPVYLWLRAFPGEARQVRAVRQWIESLLPGCEARETLALAASEFGANAIEHTRSGEPGGRFTVHLAWSPAAVRITVGDQGSPLPPEAVTATLDSEHGRGLFMVDAMATNWGFTDGPEGRLLWADVPWLEQGGPSTSRRTARCR